MAGAADSDRAVARFLCRRSRENLDLGPRVGHVGSHGHTAAASAIPHLGCRSPRQLGQPHRRTSPGRPPDGGRNDRGRNVLSSLALQPQASGSARSWRDEPHHRHPHADGAHVRAVPRHQRLLGAMGSRRGTPARVDSATNRHAGDLRRGVRPLPTHGRGTPAARLAPPRRIPRRAPGLAGHPRAFPATLARGLPDRHARHRQGRIACSPASTPTAHWRTCFRSGGSCSHSSTCLRFPGSAAACTGAIADRRHTATCAVPLRSPMSPTSSETDRGAAGVSPAR